MNSLNTSLSSRIICPACGKPLKKSPDGNWSCTAHFYKELKGVPILREIIDNNIYPNKNTDVFGVEVILSKRGVVGLIKKIIGTNYVPYPPNPIEYISNGGLILNVGAGMTDPFTPNTVNLDYFLYPTTNLVADAANIPIASNTFDSVISEFMLEHVPSPFQVSKEMIRVLKPGGLLYVTYPFIHPYHSFPSDFYRFSYSGIKKLFAGMELVSQGPLTGPACRWIGATADLICSFFKNERIQFLLRTVILTILFPIKFLDLILNRLPNVMDNSVTLYAIFRKPTAIL
jgi:SAM-dependent methyltransferase